MTEFDKKFFYSMNQLTLYHVLDSNFAPERNDKIIQNKKVIYWFNKEPRLVRMRAHQHL